MKLSLAKLSLITEPLVCQRVTLISWEEPGDEVTRRVLDDCRKFKGQCVKGSP